MFMDYLLPVIGVSLCSYGIYYYLSKSRHQDNKRGEEEPISQLSLAFPHINRDVIVYALSKSHGNVNEAAQELLSLTPSAETLSPSSISSISLSSHGSSISTSGTRPEWSTDPKKRQQVLNQKKQRVLEEARAKYLANL